MTSPSIPVISLDDLVDADHAAVLGMLPPDLVSFSGGIDVARAAVNALFDALPTPEVPPTVTVGETTVPGVDGSPEVRVRTYVPETLAENAAVILWIHGGGMVLLDADSDDGRCVDLTLRTGCPIVSVDYRLAPENPAPAAVQDCYAALCWTAENSSELGVDAGRVIVMGSSAGGGLAAGTALWTRDHGGPAPLGLSLVYPMLDHRNETPSSHAVTDGRVWNRDANLYAWDAYLGGADPSIYASPTTADDLSGLPPTFIIVGTLDMFLDENVAFANRLHVAGVHCELSVHPGAFHASNVLCPASALSQRWAAAEDAFIAGLIAGHLQSSE